VRTFFRQGGGGVLQMRTCGRPHFFAQTTSDFLKFMMCPHGQGGEGVELV